MANNVNAKVSILVSSQVPQFIRDDHPTFVAFLEAYYEYLEQEQTALQQGRLIERRKNLRNYQDVDKSLDRFSSHFFNEFLALIPRTIRADKALVLKYAKDFYRAKGTEKSYRFLLRILSPDPTINVDFYYPKQDIYSGIRR